MAVLIKDPMMRCHVEGEKILITGPAGRIAFGIA
jgi:hypothetical protein